MAFFMRFARSRPTSYCTLLGRIGHWVKLSKIVRGLIINWVINYLTNHFTVLLERLQYCASTSCKNTRCEVLNLFLSILKQNLKEFFFLPPLFFFLNFFFNQESKLLSWYTFYLSHILAVHN